MLRATTRDGREWEIEREFTDPRLEVVRLLHEAAQIEHSLMLQYLYAAYSVKPRYADVVGKPRNGAGLVRVAVQEMHHLASVNSILAGLGAAPSLTHQDFPYEPEIYPFEMKLERLSKKSLARYVFAEAPRGALDPDGGRNRELAREVLALLAEERGRDAPAPNHIGSLYRTVIARLEELKQKERHAGVDAWIAQLGEIQREGEHDHFEFFASLFRANYRSLGRVPDVWRDPDSAEYPSNPVPENPTALIGRPGAIAEPLAGVARIGNRAYWSALIVLEYAYGAESARDRALAAQAIALMEGAIDPIAKLLAANGQGMPFDPLSLGYAPCRDASENLRTAVEFLSNANDALDQLPSGLGNAALAIRPVLLSVRDAVDRAAQRAGTVVVIGGGPAGLAAAFALADRGVPVRLLEQGSTVGGKVSSEMLGSNPPRSYEHGAHGWWKGYLNFFDVIERAGGDLEAAFYREEESNLLVDKGVFAKMESVADWLPSPLFLVAQILNAPYLDGVKELWALSAFSIHALAFRHERDYSQYDAYSLTQLLEALGVRPKAQNFLFRPFALNFDYALPLETSASSVLSAFQFYTLPSQDSLLPRWTRAIPERVVFGPIVKGIERKGGRVECAASVASVVIQGSVVRGVEVETRGFEEDDAGAEVVATLAPAELSKVPASGFKEQKTTDGTRIYIGKDANGKWLVLPAICTHAFGDLEWKPPRFVCRTHGGCFTAQGKIESGPPQHDLKPLDSQLDPNGNLIVRAKRRRFRLPCADVIVATDVPAAQRIFEASPGFPSALQAQISHLETTPLFAVRMWFAKDTKITQKDVRTAITPICEVVDNFFYLNRIDPSYDAEGEVIEMQGCRSFDKWGDMPDAQLVQWILDDLTRNGLLVSGLAPAHYFVNRHVKVFTKYAPGQERYRPGARTGVPGLYLAGDWTKADWSSWFMERAVISGLRAANEVLEARGLRPQPIRRLPPEGLLLRASRLAARLALPFFPIRLPGVKASEHRRSDPVPAAGSRPRPGSRPRAGATSASAGD
jgi:predicted NAD/FAD-dependent oxidoreductase/Rieske Fe-S protein